MIWRLKVLSFLIFISFLLVIGRLFYWQIFKGEELTLWALSQYIKVSEIPAARGEIKTSDNFPLVTNAPGFLLFANPKEIKEKKSEKLIIRGLSPILEIEEASIAAVLAQDLVWVPLKDKIDSETKEKIESLELSGIGFEKRDFRFYPEASMAAHLTGFVGKDESGENRGYFGLEGYYNRELRGRPGRIREIKDPKGRPILLAGRKIEEKIDGQNFVLHLDRRLQLIAQKRLKEGVEKYGAKGGIAVVMDPKTGGILASTSYPAYSQEKYQEGETSLFKDPLVAETYEPGSTFKVLVMAAALNEEVLTVQTECDICGGPITIGDYTIRTWNNKYFPKTSMLETIEHSDNTGMVFVGRKLGLEKLFSYLEKFGMGSLTGIDLQGEANLPLRMKTEWRPIDLATASFGQGIAVTPVQMLTAVATLANGGKLMEPHVVAKIIDERGKEIVIEPRVLREVISQNAAKLMTEMMVNSVEKGEAKWTKLPGYRIAGKTGTSQIPIAGHYDPTKTVTSFVGFAPADPSADGPKFVMLVKINEPSTSPYGSENAAPIFFKIAREILNYYGIPPKE